LWAEPAAPDPPQRGRRDAVLAAIVLAAAALETVARPDLTWRPVAAALGCGLAVAVLFRRARPLPATALGFGAIALVDVAAHLAGADPVVLYSGSVVLLLAYSLLRWGSGRDTVLGLAVMAAGFATAVGTDPTAAGDAIGGAGVLLSAAALGLAIRYRGSAREHLIERAKVAEREQLARELHDTVAHHVTAIAVQAQAGLFLARSSSSLTGATDALEIIDREAAQTLTEMRAMVGALRDRRNRPTLAPQQGLAAIEHLASPTQEPRVDVQLLGDLQNLPPAVEAALFRVAQESVTNARRHTRDATRIEVTVTATATHVQLTVTDDGSRTSTASTGPPPGGYGLVGMTERVTLLGGTLTAGPNPGRGWTVRADLPRRGGTR
jgi:signal transduction histidine kinase